MLLLCLRRRTHASSVLRRRTLLVAIRPGPSLRLLHLVLRRHHRIRLGTTLHWLTRKAALLRLSGPHRTLLLLLLLLLSGRRSGLRRASLLWFRLSLAFELLA